MRCVAGRTQRALVHVNPRTSLEVGVVSEIHVPARGHGRMNVGIACDPSLALRALMPSVLLETRSKAKRCAGAGARVGGGFILLEVVLSLALLLMGLTYIGAQIQNAQATAYETENLTRILMLVEMKLAELDTGLINLDEEADNEVEGDFTLRIPDYGWRMRFDPTATEGLRAITLDILYAPRLNLEEDFDVDGAKVVHTVYALRAVPAKVDLQAHFGFTEDSISVLSETSPMEEDWHDFDLPGAGRDWPMEDLIDWLLAMVTASGQSVDQLSSVLPEEFSDLLRLRSEFAGLGDADDEDAADGDLDNGGATDADPSVPENGSRGAGDKS